MNVEKKEKIGIIVNSLFNNTNSGKIVWDMKQGCININTFVFTYKVNADTKFSLTFDLNENNDALTNTSIIITMYNKDIKSGFTLISSYDFPDVFKLAEWLYCNKIKDIIYFPKYIGVYDSIIESIQPGKIREDKIDKILEDEVLEDKIKKKPWYKFLMKSKKLTKK